MTKSTLNNYMQKGIVGGSPLRKGRRSHIPRYFFELLATHVSMKQLEGQAEARPRTLKTLIAAALYDTELKSADKEWVYKRFRRKFPHIVQPSKVMQVEERRGLWTTYGNLNQWFDGS